MNIREIIFGTIGLLLLSCSGNNDKENREAAYAAQLEQQIAAVTQSIDSCDKAIADMRDIEDQRLAEFTTISNPLEAAPYILYTPTKDLYPITKTGVVARMADNGQFELIAAMSGGRFDRIKVYSGVLEAESQAVPADQALNYTADGLNTVLFSGAEADSIGMLINGNDDTSFKIDYISANGQTVKSSSITQREALMIGRTYALYHARKEINRLERRIPMLSHKIAILRQHLTKVKPDSVKQ